MNPPPTGDRDAVAPSRHDLYEVCVQSAADLPPLITAVAAEISSADDTQPAHAPAAPTVLAEDFAGTNALSRAWIDQITGGTAVATDHDDDALAHHGPPPPGLTIRHGDVLSVTDPAHVLFVGNFSIGYCHTRAELVRYLTHARARLVAGTASGPPADRPAGVFLCDTYGGESAFLIGDVHRDHWISAERHGKANPSLIPYDGCRVRYTWQQRHADPLTGMVTDVCHFRLDRTNTVEHDYPNAFVYEWRLWSVPELRDAMAEAGFTETRVYSKLPDAVDHEGRVYIEPITEPENELDDSFIVLVAGRAS